MSGNNKCGNSWPVCGSQRNTASSSWNSLPVSYGTVEYKAEKRHQVRELVGLSSRIPQVTKLVAPRPKRMLHRAGNIALLGDARKCGDKVKPPAAQPSTRSQFTRVSVAIIVETAVVSAAPRRQPLSPTVIRRPHRSCLCLARPRRCRKHERASAERWHVTDNNGGWHTRRSP